MALWTRKVSDSASLRFSWRVTLGRRPQGSLLANAALSMMSCRLFMGRTSSTRMHPNSRLARVLIWILFAPR